MAHTATRIPMMDHAGPSEHILRILTGSARLLPTKGCEGTPMHDIAAPCGISKSLRHHHFAEKDEIFACIAFNSTRELCEFVTARIPENAAPAERIRTFMIGTAEHFYRYRWIWPASTSRLLERPGSPAAEGAHEVAGPLRRPAALPADGADQGKMRPLDVSHAGRLILSSLNWMPDW